MKILICGKGGSGKSTLASLLAKNLQTKGYRVLVVDADESNYGLSAQLGLKDPKELMEQIGGKKAAIERMWAKRGEGEKPPYFTEAWRIDDIPREYVSQNGDGVYLLQIGKVKHFGEGCACPMGGLSREFLSHLKLEPKDVAVIDTEAGVEHIGRGVAGSVDLVLAVLDPSYESIKLSQKISSMVKEAGKPVYFILNKVNDALADKIITAVGEERVIGILPYSEAILEKGLTGMVLDLKFPSIEAIANFVLEESKATQTEVIQHE
jgi:CO dehydrogenase maturation factor